MNQWNKILYNLCEYFGIVLRETALYIELQFYIKRRVTFVRYTLPFEKGLGKSYTLLKPSIKYNIPIVVETIQENKRMLENKVKYMGLKGEPNILVCDEINNKYNLLLIDEGLTLSQINNLKKLSNILIGYAIINNETIEEN